MADHGATPPPGGAPARDLAGAHDEVRDEGSGGAGGVGGSTTLTVPNAISAARLLLVPVFALLLVNGEDLWALIVLAVAGASDWLDGKLARVLDQRSRLGELLDPAADRLFIAVTLVMLVVRDVVPLWLLVAIVLRDLLLSVVLVVLSRAGIGPLPVHLVGKAGTFALLYAFPLLLLGAWSGPLGLVAGVVGWAFACWGVALYWLAGAVYVKQAVSELVRSRRRAVA